VALLLYTTSAGDIHVPQQLRKLIALWFVVQIALPFTAPLSTCNLVDLLGTTHQHGAPASPLSSMRQMPTEVDADAKAFFSPLTVPLLRALSEIAVDDRLALSGPLMATFELSPSSHVQQSVLRL
jgi:hypothetical protein